MSAERPQIEFPCEYPVSIVGDAADDFRALVEEIVERHAPGFERAHTHVQPSRGGRYQSVRVVIVATGVDQLQALNAELKATGRVHTVL
jgi:putative lipoic acid-binding regulatory protein